MKKYIFLLMWLLAGLFSAHAQQVAISPSSISVPQQGGTYTLSVTYAPAPDSLFDWSMARYSVPYSNIQVSNIGDRTVRVTFPANTGYTTRSGSITLYYPDPQNYYGNQISGTCTFSQQGLTPDYAIQIAPTSINHPAEGGTRSLQVSYKNRTEAVNATFLGASGLPSGFTLTAGSNGTLSLYGGANKSGSVISGTVTVSYSNPLNANRPETASFTVTQQPIPSWISLSPKELSVSGTGGSYYCSVAYSNPDTIFSIDYRSYSGGASQLNSVSASGSNQIKFDFKKNLTQSTINGQITVYVTDPINSSRQISDVVSFSQPPAPYDIQIAPSSTSLPAAGGSQTIQTNYVYRDGPVTLSYLSCSGLPSWCTLTPGSNGALSLSSTSNTSSSTRTATVTVSYANPLNTSQPVTASFTISQQPLSYNITIPNNSLSVTAAGETKALSLAYVDRTGTVNLTYQSCSGLPSGATVTSNSNGTFSVTFPSNTTSSTRSGTATIYYNNPISGAQPVSATFTYSQQPLSYNITIPNNSLSVAAAGETKTLSLAYVDRTGTVNLTYQSCSGLPSGATVTSNSNGTFSVTFPSNTTSSTRSGTATIYYNNPISGAQPVSATFTYSQQPLSYNITIPNNSLTVAASGETKTITLAYTDRTGSVSLTFLNSSGVPNWCTLTANSGGTLTAVCTANSGNSARSATITVSYANPLNSNQPVTASFSLSQQPQSYAIRTASNSYSIAANGGTSSVSVVYAERTGSMNLEYRSCSGVPDWCAVQASSGGHLTLSASRNISGFSRSGSITVSYENPLNSSQPVTATFTVIQEPLSSWITITPKNATVNGVGETKSFDVAYSVDSLVTFEFLSYSGGAGQIASCRMENNQFKVVFEPNLTEVTISGSATFTFKDPANPAQTLSDVISFTQEPAPFSIQFQQNDLELASEGGTQTLNVVYTDRTGPVTLTYLSCSNHADWFSLSPGSNGSISLSFSPNEESAVRNASVSVYYENPLDDNHPVTATLSISQAPLNYDIVLPSQNIIVPAHGGDIEIPVSYAHREGPVTLTFQRANFVQGGSLPLGWAISPNDNYNLNFHVDANNTWETRSGSIEVSYTNPLSSSPIKGTFTYYQEPLDFSIHFTSHTQLAAVAEGQTYTLQLGYLSLDEPIQAYQIIYQQATGLPVGSQITAGENGELSIFIPGNDTGSERSGILTVTYIDPNNSDHSVSATLPYTQPALNYSLQIDTPSFTVAPEGGTQHLQVSFSGQQSLQSPIYAGSSGLPDDCMLIASDDGNLLLQVGANPLWSTRQIECQLFYFVPDDQTATISTSFTFTQAALDHSIGVSPQSISIAPGGESKNLWVTYSEQDKPLTLAYKECTGLPQGAFITEHPLIPGLLTVSFPANTGTTPKNGRITIVYEDNDTEQQEETYVDYSQETGREMVILNSSALSVSPAGGTYMVNVNVVYPDSLDHTPIYRGTSNLPSDIEVQGSPTMVHITFPANETGEPRYGSIQIFYADPSDTTQNISNTVSYVQASHTLSSFSAGRVMQRIYRNGNGSHYNLTVTYQDGLGRSVQSVQVGAAPVTSILPQGGDWISFQEYDCMGRSDSISYLPYVRTLASGASTSADMDPYTSQQTFYANKFGTNTAPYAMMHTMYGTGLGMVQVRNMPGEAHRLSDGYYTRYNYRLNTTADAIVRYTVQSDGSLLAQGTFGAGQLLVYNTVDTRDNDQSQRQEIFEYIDSQGRTLAREVYISSTDRRITYYVYDDLGRLRYILPPMADTINCSTPKTAQELGDYCYYMEYDERGQLARTQNPGAEYVLSIYDRRGRLVMSQDGKQRADNEWTFVKYDIFDRPILSGVVTGGTFESHRTALEATTVWYEERGSAVHGYTNQSYPSVADENAYLTVTYYDDYDWLGTDDTYAFSAEDAPQQSPAGSVQGLLTGTKTKVLGIDASSWLTSVTYYDALYHPIQSLSDLYPSGIEITSNTYNFTGQVTWTNVKQTVSGTTYGYEKWFIYDGFGRLLSVRQRVDGDNLNGTVTLASYTYDELGNVAEKSIHNQSETQAYTYDLNGRISSVTSPSFSYGLDYEQSTVTGAVARWDGNISALRWGAGSTPDKAYTYSYDAVGQLTSAGYRTASEGTWNVSNAYAEKNLSYDRHGNLKTLQRTDVSGNTWHDLTEMTYDGNRLQSLRLNGGSAVTYTYDPNGNMITDGRRGVTIGYNRLNLPEEILAGDQKISYIYSASGEKLACEANGSLTYYRGGVMVYGADNKLLYMLTPEGTVSRSEGSSGSTYTYNYFVKDHIGSTRVVLAAVGDTLQEIQSTDYYPFGLAFSTNNLNKNKLLFSGKEFQDGTLGGSMLGLYDFGARFYDPMIGRWTTTDPLARKYIGLSPYNYCANNPARFMDPSGMTIDTLSEKEFASIWSSLRNDMLSSQNRLNTLNAADHEWQSIGMQNNIASLEMRIASIDYTLQTMNIMHSSSQLYSLNRIGPTDIGGLRLDVVSGRNAIVVSYGSISNFVHEAVHVRQFEEGRVAFSMSSGSPMLNDIYKEVEAYQIQYDYDPLSVQGLISSGGSIVSREGITPAWVQGLYDGNANQPYKPGGYAKTAEIALDRNSTLKDLIPAYPSMGLTYSPDVDLNANLFDYFNLYYKNGPIK